MKKRKIDVDEMDEIFRKATEMYYQTKGSKSVRNSDGEYNDFME